MVDMASLVTERSAGGQGPEMEKENGEKGKERTRQGS
jgi:hypothetical protein